MVVKILMVDDHQAILEGYKAMLALNKEQHTLEVTTADTCEEAYHIISEAKNANYFDLVFLDYSIPATYPEKKIFGGEDLGVLVRKQMPTTKIIMLTSHFDAIRLYNVVKKINPNGLLIKSDFKPQELLEAFDAVLNGEVYMTATAKEKLKEPLFTQGLLDGIDRDIITLLVEGLKNNTIAQRLGVSDSSVEKRKSKIKDYLNLSKCNDEVLIIELRRIGLV